MNEHDATEIAYKNGYKDGYNQAIKDAIELLKKKTNSEDEKK